MAVIKKNERLLNLVAFLLKTPRPAAWTVIRRDVEGYRLGDDAEDRDEIAVARRFERDKAALRRMGIPIEYADDELGEPGYFIPPDSYFLPRMEFSAEEVVTLALVARAAMGTNGGDFSPWAEALATALQKLQFDSPIPGDVRAAAAERYLFHDPTVGDAPPGKAALATIAEAALAGKTVRFRYRDAAGKAAARTVDPYGIASWRGHWYIVGRAHERDAIRLFRADRIVADAAIVNPQGSADFSIPPGFRVEDHVGRPPWELARAQPEDVAVAFDKVAAWMVKENLLPGDRWRDTPGGGGRLERRVNDSRTFLGWLLRFGAHARIESPRTLRQQVVDRLRDIRARYQAAPNAPRGEKRAET